MAEIRLQQGEVAHVDDDMVDVLSQYRWYANTGYAAAEIGGKTALMHRLILAPQDDKLVDHKNGNRLDNRRENLRECTHSENMRNRKMHENNQCGLKGVYKDSRRKRNPYRAQIRVDGMKIGLGVFPTADAAFEAYAAAAKRYHNEFARI